MGYQKGTIRRAPDKEIEIQGLGLVDYRETWDRQAKLAAQRADGEITDTLLLLEHPPTYTAGKRTEDSDRPTNGLPVVDIDRGGRITWHADNWWPTPSFSWTTRWMLLITCVGSKKP